MSTVVVDAIGESCPVPVILLARAIAEAPVGGEVVVVADDLGTGLDVPVWCRMKGHTYLGEEPAPRGHAYRVRRAG